MIEKSVETFEENGVQYEKTTYYEISESGEKVIRGTATVAIPELTDPEPSQLDRIEAAVAKSNKEIKNEAIDEYTAMLMEEGVL